MLEAAQQQTRPGQQHDRESDLADDQHLPETRLAAAAGGGTPGFPQHALEVRPRLLHCRHEADCEPGGERGHEAEREHRDPAAGPARRARDDLRRGCQQNARQHARAQQTDEAARERQQHALEHELPRQPPP